ncbi:MAG: hypothetical protein ACOYXM_12530 [Actinomycetota bacterium]
MRGRFAGDRRLLSTMAAVAVLLAASLTGCGGDEDDSSAPSSVTDTSAAAPGGTDGTGGSDGSSTTRAGSPPGSAGGNGGEGSTSTTAAPPLIEVGSLAVGGVAEALLQPGRGDRIVLEVRAQEGAEPAGATIDRIVDELTAASGKDVVVDGPDRIGGGADEWAQSEVIAAARSAAQAESGRVQVVLRLLFLRGSYEGNGSVLGVAVAGDVAAVFSDQVESAAGLLVSPAVVEDAVSMHEIGHLLGLVDLVLGTGRGDPEHPGHSRNDRSVMYWQVESDLITQLLDGGIPREFDADDRAELAQIRAR